MATTTRTAEGSIPRPGMVKITSSREHPKYYYYGCEPGKTVLRQGHTRFEGRRLPFPTDTIFDRDVSIPLRDGINLYADVFRPVDTDADGKVPAILPYSPYGKTGTGVMQYENMAPFSVGLRKDQTSGYEKFEGPDPADWVNRGTLLSTWMPEVWVALVVIACSGVSKRRKMSTTRSTGYLDSLGATDLSACVVTPGWPSHKSILRPDWNTLRSKLWHHGRANRCVSRHPCTWRKEAQSFPSSVLDGWVCRSQLG